MVSVQVTKFKVGYVMMAAKNIRSFKALPVVLSLSLSALAQTPVTPRAPEGPRNRIPRPVQVESTVSAPQVVTILHRLNGLKVIRLLLRGNEQRGAIANLDDAFQIAGEVHTNVIAGLTLSDGQTIAAWLPEAEAELPPAVWFAPPAPQPPGSGAAIRSSGVPSGAAPLPPNAFHRTLATVDVKVVTRDGRNLLAQYVGLDGLTGLSVITLNDTNLPKRPDVAENSIETGQRVRLIGPEPVLQPDATARGGDYFRVGEIEASVVDVTRTATKTLARVRIKSAKITPANIGAGAVNDAGEALGIVNAVAGDEASILPIGLVRSAAGRVLARQASVPRPWLGVRGEPIGRLSLDRILKVGWAMDRARLLAEKRQGILLTSVAPGSPAAMAELKPGDVILRVNDEMIQNADDFSMFLQEAAPGSFVNFTVMRPGALDFAAFKIKLGESPEPFFGPRTFEFRTPAPPPMLVPGMEAVAIKPRVATRLGATGGLLIVYVQPNSVAFEAGLRPGDVIESVNGESFVMRSANGQVNKRTSRTVVVVRNKKKLTITIPPAK